MEFNLQLVESLTYIIKLMVDQPDQVKLISLEQPPRWVIRLYVAPKDIGKVIGKQGKTARAFRQILEAVSMSTGIRIIFEIDETASSISIPE